MQSALPTAQNQVELLCWWLGGQRKAAEGCWNVGIVKENRIGRGQVRCLVAAIRDIPRKNQGPTLAKPGQEENSGAT